MFNPRSTRSPTPAGLPLGYFCMNVQSALHAEPDALKAERIPNFAANVQSALHAEPDLFLLLVGTGPTNVQSALHAEPDPPAPHRPLACR